MTVPLRIVDKPVEADEATVLANCWQQANARSLAFLIAVAQHVPTDLLHQWHVCYRDAEFTDSWLPATAVAAISHRQNHSDEIAQALASAA